MSKRKELTNRIRFFRNRFKSLFAVCTGLVILFMSTLLNAKAHKNFKVSVYTRAYEVQKMEDPQYLDSTWQAISSQMKLDKIYLETHRDTRIVDQKTLTRAKKFFESKGLEVAGGITYTIDEGNFFHTYCYSSPEDRKKVQEIIEYSAKNFDEVILDDFFFTSCKCKNCVKAKGDRSWSEYRLEMMTEASKNLIVGPAKAVNPNVKVIIKYPNWYDHFQECGFNLETQPHIFDGVYTGTETRDAVMSEQHLQPYEGYLIFRYFYNLSSGRNGGGWVDPGGMMHLDRYAEQLWLTLLAKAPEQTLFDYRRLPSPLGERLIPEWKNEKTSFDYASFLPLKKTTNIATLADHSLDIIDEVVGHLGNPVGIPSYKPYHSSGEDFLENYLGMIGIPMDLVPEFPAESDMVILTEHAKKDPEIVEKIKQHLLDGKHVMITSGLVDALQERGLRNLVNLEYTSRKSNVSEFMVQRRIVESASPMIIPQIQYNTNDSWEMISGMDSGLGWPLFHYASFADGALYMLVIPENFADLYNLPVEVLNQIREIVCSPLGIELNGGAMVSLFVYDNGTFVVESFNDEAVEVEVRLAKKADALIDLVSNDALELKKISEGRRWRGFTSTEKYGCKIILPPRSFRTFKIK